jgi:2,4-diaminopentanoate dehydrogenase
VPYRVVHCGTGNIGREALAGVIHHRDLELVGQYVWSPGDPALLVAQCLGRPVGVGR